MSLQARILLLCDNRRNAPNTVLDHIQAFRQYSRHQVRTFNTRDMARSVALDFDHFDVVVIHYSVVLSSLHYLSEGFRDQLRRFRGLKIEFIQDDYRWIDRETAASRDIGVNVLFTVVPEPAAGKIYDKRLPGVRRLQTLTGYVPDNLVGRPWKPLRERTIDVGYRARDLPFWLGRLSREKAWIGQRFLELAPAYGLRCDIALSEDKRIYGDRWIEFMSSCRATLGTESGASIADFDGSVERAVMDYLAAHPGAPYEEVHEAVLRPYEGNVVMNIISPRVFEAAALGTVLVMFPGEYSGVATAGRHYIALEKDFSNMDDVVGRLRDDILVEAMTAQTHDDLIRSGRWSYSRFIADFDRVVDEQAEIMRGRSLAPRFRLARIERQLRVPSIRVRLLRGAQAAWRRVSGRGPLPGLIVENESQIDKGILALQILLFEGDLRHLFRLGRGAGAPLSRLLSEIVTLSLLRRVAEGRIRVRPYLVRAEFDAGRQTLRFITHSSPDRTTDPETTAHAVRDAFRRGQLTKIEWDHRALGGKIYLDRPSMVLDIGLDGLETFSVLSGIGRRHPSALDKALRPLLSATWSAPGPARLTP